MGANTVPARFVILIYDLLRVKPRIGVERVNTWQRFGLVEGILAGVVGVVLPQLMPSQFFRGTVSIDCSYHGARLVGQGTIARCGRG